MITFQSRWNNIYILVSLYHTCIIVNTSQNFNHIALQLIYWRFEIQDWLRLAKAMGNAGDITAQSRAIRKCRAITHSPDTVRIPAEYKPKPTNTSQRSTTKKIESHKRRVNVQRRCVPRWLPNVIHTKYLPTPIKRAPRTRNSKIQNRGTMTKENRKCCSLPVRTNSH